MQVVRVFKIEECARVSEYVRTVVECYKEAVKSYCEGTFTDEKVDNWDERLATVFNRGFWDGYYSKEARRARRAPASSGATKRKVYIGKGSKHFQI